MATYRPVYKKFWTDPDVSECSGNEKYFLLSAMTFPNVNMCGCYEITLKQIAEFMCISKEEVEKIINSFEKKDKFIEYDKSTRELFWKNWYKYNWTNSPKLDRVLRQEISWVKSKKFKSILIERYNSRISVQDGKSIPLSDSEIECIPVDSEDGALGVEEETAEDSVAEAVENKSEDAPEEEETISKGNRPPSVPYNKIMSLWNEICVSLPAVKGCSGNRKIFVEARWKEFPDIEVFKTAFENAEKSSFMRGSNNRGWMANFDWVMKPTNFQKVYEDRYKDNDGGNQFSMGSGTSYGDGWDFIKGVAGGAK